MITALIYFSAIFAELIFLAGFILYTSFLIYSHLKGAPYVPTANKEIDSILKEADLKTNDIFLELGCGDGRVVRRAVQRYHVQGIGVDVNPLLLYQGKIMSKINKLDGNIIFKKENMLQSNFGEADTIYLFLLPDLIKKILPKLEKGTKKNCLFISHGFKIHNWQQYLTKTIDHSPFPTYYYKFSARGVDLILCQK